MADWRDGPRSPRDRGPAPPDTWTEHHWDGRLRARLFDNPDLTVVVVDVPALRDGRPAFTVLTSTTCDLAWSVTFDGPVAGHQLPPADRGLIPTAWIETTGHVYLQPPLLVDWDPDPE